MEELEGRHVRLWVASVTRGRWVARDVRMRGSVEM